MCTELTESGSKSPTLYPKDSTSKKCRKNTWNSMNDFYDTALTRCPRTNYE